jgi:hypothetical protein
MQLELWRFTDCRKKKEKEKKGSLVNQGLVFARVAH